jgi:putative ABC transport system ATP-binding protein
MLLETQNISKQYGEEVILDQISLVIKQAESLAITGPSGSGKSTLLSILGLLLEPTGGDIYLKQQTVSNLSDDKRSEIRNHSFGFIFQSTQLIGSLTVLDNVLVPAYLGRKPNLESKAIKILTELGLQNRMNYYPYQLSIGQKRRVAIARAILLDPAIVFADEPTNDLDPVRAAQIGDFLYSLPQKGCALILVTHDPSLAEKADKTIEIVNGKAIEICRSVAGPTKNKIYA